MKGVIDRLGGAQCVVHSSECADVARTMEEQGAAFVTSNAAVNEAGRLESLTAGYRRVIRLRANHEVDWQCGLVKACIELGLPERSASRPDLPLQGVRHALHISHEGLLLWIDDAHDEERIQPLVDEWSELQRDGKRFHLLVTEREASSETADAAVLISNVDSMAEKLAQLGACQRLSLEDLDCLQAMRPMIESATALSKVRLDANRLLELSIDPLDRIGACETAVKLLDFLIESQTPDLDSERSLANARLLARRGDIRLRQQRFLQARKDYRMCDQLLHAAHAAESELALRVTLSIIETDLNECRLARAATRFVAAENLVRRLNPPEAELARYWILRGAFHLQAGRAATAESHFTKAAWQLRGGSEGGGCALLHRIRLLMARACFAQGKSRDAERELRRDIESRSEDGGAASLEASAPTLMLADLLMAAGRFAEAEPLLRGLLHMRRHSLGRRHRLTGETLNRLAVALSQCGDTRAADAMFQQAIEIHKEVYGEQHPEVANALNDQAEALFAHGRYEESQRLMEQALAIQEQTLRKTDQRLARTRNNLAALHSARGQFERAEDLYRRDLEVKREKLPPRHPAIADVLNNLGTVYSAQGRWDEADERLREALEIRQGVWPDDHPSVAQSLNNLGYLRLQQRRYCEALILLRRSLVMREAQLAPRHPHIAATCEAIGEALFRQGDLEESLPMFQHALEVCEAAFGDSHQRTAHVMAQLGRVEARLARRARAELHLRKSEQNLLRTVGRRHAFRATALCGMAELHELDGRYDEAQEDWDQAYAILQRSTGSQLATSDVLLALGHNQMQRKLPAKAAESWSKCLKLRMHWLKEGHLETAHAMLRLSTALVALNEIDRADSLLSDALDVFNSHGHAADELRAEAMLTKADVAVARSQLPDAETLLMQCLELQRDDASPRLRPVTLLSRLAGVYQLQEEFDRAVPLIEECIRLTETERGMKHPELATYCEHLANVYAGLGRLAEAEAAMRRAINILEAEQGENHPAVLELLESYSALLRRVDRQGDAELLQNRIEQLQVRGSHVLDEIM